MVFASEGEADRPMAEALLKRLTGSDPVTARFMRKEFFTFRPTFMLWLATNNKPVFRGQDEGLWRRVKMVEFRRYFAPDERDHRLGQRLLEEAPGIVAWAVRGAVEWFSNGLGEPAPVVAATSEYRQTSDPLAGFLPGVVVADPDAKRMKGKDLYDFYTAWTQDEGLKPSEVWTRRTFFARIEERGFVRRKTEHGVAFDGLRRARPSDNAVEVEVVEPVPSPLRVVSGPSLEEV
jgi:putative DNA primase/helicase